jgi:glycosyltransferase involved in cell wall biosynthesis
MIDFRPAQDDASRVNQVAPRGAASVSVLTPSLNQGRFLADTLRSVAAQNYLNLEHIVVDGGSTDGSVEILRHWADSHPSCRWVSEPDNGQTDAINKALQMARGEIIGWLNSDDVYCDGAVQAAVAALQAHPELLMIYGDVWMMDQGGVLRHRADWVQDYDLRRLYRVENYIAQPAVFLRRRAFDLVGPLDATLHWTMDWDLWIRVGKAGPVKRIPEVLACIRDYPATKSNSGGGRRFREITRLVRRHSQERFPPAYFRYLYAWFFLAIRGRIAPGRV